MQLPGNIAVACLYKLVITWHSDVSFFINILSMFRSYKYSCSHMAGCNPIFSLIRINHTSLMKFTDYIGENDTRDGLPQLLTPSRFSQICCLPELRCGHFSSGVGMATARLVRMISFL